MGRGSCIRSRLRHLLPAVLAILALGVVGAGLAWACTQQGFINVDPARGPAGSVTEVRGSNFFDANDGEISFHWQTAGGPVLDRANGYGKAEGLPGPNPSARVRIPDNAAAGTYAIVAVAKSDEDSRYEGATFTSRAPFTVLPRTCAGREATIVGTGGEDSGDEALVGGPDDDVIAGRGGDDEINGRGGNDIICAGPGDDRVDGGAGDDGVAGEEGDDRLVKSDGKDVLHGGSNPDTLAGGPNGDILVGGTGDDRAAGGNGQDRALGGEGDDELLGRDQDDRLFGQNGNDDLDGGAGSDRCEGGGGNQDTGSDCEMEKGIP